MTRLGKKLDGSGKVEGGVEVEERVDDEEVGKEAKF